MPQHDGGDRPCRRAAAFPCNANIRAFEGKHIIHAVADHCHELAVLLQGADQGFLLLGRDSPKYSRLDGSCGELADSSEPGPYPKPSSGRPENLPAWLMPPRSAGYRPR